MRRLTLQIAALGLVSAVAFTATSTVCEMCHLFWWHGYDLDLFGLRFEGAVGNVTYSVANLVGWTLGLACLGAWCVWCFTAAERPGAATTGPIPTAPRLRKTAWFWAVGYGCLLGAVWAFLYVIGPDVFETFLQTGRFTVLALLAFACTLHLRFSWQTPPVQPSSASPIQMESIGENLDKPGTLA